MHVLAFLTHSQEHMAAVKQGARAAGACTSAADGAREQTGWQGTSCTPQSAREEAVRIGEGAGGAADPRMCVWAEDPDTVGTAQDAMWRRIHEVLSKRRRRGGRQGLHVQVHACSSLPARMAGLCSAALDPCLGVACACMPWLLGVCV